MKKLVLYKELCYLGGVFSLALGAVLMVKANFGMSVVVSPSYLIHLKLSQTWSFVTFGVAEYIMQGAILLFLIAIVRQFHWSYLCSFVTTLFYGRVLDFIMLIMAPIELTSFLLRFLFFVPGLILCAFGVCLMLHTYLPPEVYELFLKVFSAKYHTDMGKLKVRYDCCSCVVAIAFSFWFFGFGPLVGVGWGSVAAALISGRLVGLFTRGLNRFFTLRPALPKLEQFFAPPPFVEKNS